MDWRFWVIICLLGLSYLQYSSPAKTNKQLEPFWGKVKEFIDGKNPLNKININSNNSSENTCSTTYEPVCGNGVTYGNSCLAALAGVYSLTAGEC